MLSKRLKIASALLCLGVIPAISGCAHHRADTGMGAVSSTDTHGRTATTVAFTGAMPQYAKSGECYAPVYLPPEFDTVTERVCVREESQEIEIVPAEYDWVEEQVLVKEASTQLVEVAAQFEVQDELVETSPGYATWIKADQARCVADTPGRPPQDIFCLVSEPPTTMMIQTERLVKGPAVKEFAVPAEYQTIRIHKLVRPASTRMVTVPAEFQEVDHTVMVAPGRMDWQRVDCDAGAVDMNKEVRSVSDRNP